MSTDPPYTERLREDLEAVIARYCHGHVLTNAETIGVLYLILHDLVHDTDEGEDEE